MVAVRGRVHWLDRDRLGTVACSCYHVLTDVFAGTLERQAAPWQSAAPPAGT